MKQDTPPPISDFTIEVIYHEELDEYEACIPELARYFFTSTGNTKEEAVTRLREMFPILWYEYHTPMSEQQQQQPNERPHAYEHWLRMAAEEAIQELLVNPLSPHEWNTLLSGAMDIETTPPKAHNHFRDRLCEELLGRAVELKAHARCKH